jgi:hypothetical protein
VTLVPPDGPMCGVAECGSRVLARGLCKFHWQRWYRGTPLDAPKAGRDPSRGWVHHNGYRWISVGGEKALEHRRVVEKRIGRKLTVDEVVHHINGDKLDNRPENLEVVTRAAHTSHHRPKRRPCAKCGKDDPHQARGLCGRHYMQAKREGLL